MRYYNLYYYYYYIILCMFFLIINYDRQEQIITVPLAPKFYHKFDFFFFNLMG